MSSLVVRLETALQGLLVAWTVAALAGYAVFGLHPQLLGSTAGLARTYAMAIVGFPRLHILLGFLAVVASLHGVGRHRWWIGAAAIYAVSLGAELLGTSVGVPFAAYRYTDALGPKWFGLVPLLIPLSWCTMTLASFTIARRVLGVRGRLTTVATGVGLLLAWDLALDPAMSRLTPYWVWGATGPYFGMPLQNLVGWGITGLALHALLRVLRAKEWIDWGPPRFVRAMLVVYAANVALPVGMTIAAGIPLAALASLGAIGLTVIAARWRPVRHGRTVRPARRPEIAQ
jgi:putative membrane protein